MLPNYFKNPKSECSDICILLPRHNWPKSLAEIEDPLVLLERNLYRHPLAGLLWERQFEKALLITWMGENSELRRCSFMRNKVSFCQYTWMTSKMAGEAAELGSYVEEIEKMWTLTNLHHFLTTCTWDALNENANRMKQLLNSTPTAQGSSLKLRLKISNGCVSSCSERCRACLEPVLMVSS